MRRTEKIFPYLCLLGTALTLNSLFWSCTKNDEEEIPLQITAIAPTKGPYLTVVTITGVGFSANPADNEVTLNGKVAVVRAATATQLQAEVPKAAGTGAITVKRGVRTVTGPSFEYTPSLWVSTLAGSMEGYEDGPGIQAKFGLIAGLAMDAQGNVYAADKLNHCIRKITPEGVVSTWVGSTTPGEADGKGAAAQFNFPEGLAIDALGNVYVADAGNHRIRKVTSDGVVSTLAGSDQGFADGAGSAAKFWFPQEIEVDGAGNLYVTDSDNNRIRKITPAGLVSTLAGGTFGSQNGTGSGAQFAEPRGIALDKNGNVFVTDVEGHTIRKITPAGLVTTLAGAWGLADGPGHEAKFKNPFGLAFDAAGNLYIADRTNNRIRKMNSDNVVSTFAGSAAGYAEGPVAVALFTFPSNIVIDSKGNLIVADDGSRRVRKIAFE